jgi:protocatechuate 3,4-dioxygenase beta subunit
MKNQYLCVILLFITGITYADKKCKITKSYIDNYEPKIFNKTNSLLNKYDQVDVSCSQAIVLRGRLLDENCQPVANAKVYAWQVGCDGKYPYVPLKNKINKKLINLNSQSSFQGSAIANTNNLGEFTLITIYPVSHHMNYINLRVVSPTLKPLQTRLYLAKQPATSLYNINADYFSDNEYYFDVVAPKNKNQ